jgi:hypothetical protein
MLLNVFHYFICRELAFLAALQRLVYISAMSLVASADINLFPKRVAIARLDGPTIHHY